MSMLSVWPRDGLDGDGPNDATPGWLDSWLAADRDVDVPAGFAARVMIGIDADLRRVPSWRRALGAIGMVISGVLLVSWTASELFAQWHRVLVSTPVALVALDAGHGVVMALLSLGSPTSMVSGRIGLYGMAAVGIALLWFSATVAPRGFGHRATARRRL